MELSDYFKNVLYCDESLNDSFFIEILNDQSIYIRNNNSDVYKKLQMHYLISAKHLTYNFWKIYNIMCGTNHHQFSFQDRVYGRYVLHYAANNVMNEWHQRSMRMRISLVNSVVILIEVANKTFSGYNIKDSVYNKTAREYISNIFDGTLVRLIDNLYYKKVLRIQLCYKKYKIRKVIMNCKGIKDSLNDDIINVIIGFL